MHPKPYSIYLKGGYMVPASYAPTFVGPVMGLLQRKPDTASLTVLKPVRSYYDYPIGAKV